MSPRTFALIAALFPTLAVAQTSSAPAPGAPGHWSTITGETVSAEKDAIAIGLGWPGIRFDYLHGLSDRSDVAGRVELLYGVENTSVSKFGFGFAAPLRLVVTRKDKILLGLHFDPGIRVYTDNTQTDFFLRFPVGGLLGIQATPELRLAAAVDLNMAVQIPHTAFFQIGPAFGFATEFMVDKNLQVGLNTRFGPQFRTIAGTGADFAFTTEIAVGYRL